MATWILTKLVNVLLSVLSLFWAPEALNSEWSPFVARGSLLAATCAVHDGQNNDGTNLEVTARVTSSYGDCCQQCISAAGCVGYTWVTANSECWLKSSVDSLRIDPDVVSGSVATPPPSPTPPAPSPTPPSPAPAPGCPGGSMDACIRFCPGDRAGYKACVAECDRRCQSSPSPSPAPTPPSPSPAPTPPTPPPSPVPTPSPSCNTPVSCHGALQRKGNRIVDKNGQNVKLNGMSMFWSNWAAPFWNGDVVKYLATTWNIGIIRCPVGVSNSGGPVSGGYLSDPNGNKARLFAVVDAAIEAGIYAIIDWHVEGRCDAGQSKPFFSEVAAKYGTHENVLFETCNEPTGWAWGQGLKSYHEQVIPEIRAHSENLIICGTNTWSQDVDEAARDQLADPNVAYTLHFYSSMHKQSIRDKASSAMSSGAAIFVTEWGTEQKGEGNFDETNRWLDFLRQNSVSNANWGVYDKDSEAWAIVHQGSPPTGGWSDSQVTNSGKFVRAYFQGNSPPSPGPGPSPTPGGLKHCTGRGSCDCDCAWAVAGKCGGDDGSCCYACCCYSLDGVSHNETLLNVVV